MKRFPIFAIFVCLCTPSLKAQQAASTPENSVLPPIHAIPAPTPNSRKPITTPHQQPLTTPPSPISPEENLQKSQTGKSETAFARLVKFRKTQIRAKRNPKVVAALERSQSAKTYAEENAARREYYTLLYNLMQQQSPDLKDWIDAQRKIDTADKLPKSKKTHSHAAKHAEAL